MTDEIVAVVQGHINDNVAKQRNCAGVISRYLPEFEKELPAYLSRT